MVAVNSKTIDYKTPGAGAAGYGLTKNNSRALLDKLYQNYKIDGTQTGGNREMYNHINNWGSGYAARGGTGDQGRQLAEWARTGDTKGLNKITAYNALDYAYRAQGQQQQNKGSFWGDVGGFLKDIAPAVAGSIIIPGVGGALGASISAGAGGAIGGALAGGIQDGFKGAALGGLSGYGVGTAVGGARNYLSGKMASSGLGGGFTDASQLGLKGSDLYSSAALSGGGGAVGGGFTSAAALGLKGANLGLNFADDNVLRGGTAKWFDQPGGGFSNSSALNLRGSDLPLNFKSDVAGALGPKISSNSLYQNAGRILEAGGKLAGALTGAGAGAGGGGGGGGQPGAPSSAGLDNSSQPYVNAAYPTQNTAAIDQFGYALQDALTGRAEVQSYNALAQAGSPKLQAMQRDAAGYQRRPFANYLMR
tara:strand:+ start:3307 stop:4569 length:1263 start_codon:yes stop_codon:yes gene_type:complete